MQPDLALVGEPGGAPAVAMWSGHSNTVGQTADEVPRQLP